MAADSAIILVGDNPAALDALVAPLRQRLSRAGWSRKSHDPFIQVFAPTGGRLEVARGLDGHGVVLGEIYDREGQALSLRARGALGCRRLDAAQARPVCSDHWGRYVLVRRVEGDVAVLRDPSGALDCVVWRKAGVTLISTSAAAVIDPWLPDGIALDWDAVAALVARPGEYRHRLALTGLQAVAGGELRVVGEASTKVARSGGPRRCTGTGVRVRLPTSEGRCNGRCGRWRATGPGSPRSAAAWTPPSWRAS